MNARKEFTKATKRNALKRSNGVCEASGRLYGMEDGQRCGISLSKGVEFDHIVRACDGGGNDLENCAAVCPKCHAHKTRKFDTPQAAKTKRMGDKARGITKEGPKLQTRGFTPSPKSEKRRKKAEDMNRLPPRQIYRSADR